MRRGPRRSRRARPSGAACRPYRREWRHDPRSRLPPRPIRRHARRRPRGAPRARRPRRRRVPRRAVRGDRGARRRAASRARRAAHRVGQVGGVLRRDAAAAPARRRPDRARVAAAGAHARPDRRRRAGGVRAVAINSTNAHEWADVLAQLDRDEVDVLLVSPERLNNPSFREQQLPALVRAHRPARRRRGALHQRLGPRLPARLPPAARPHRADARAACRCSPPRRPRTAGWWRMSPSSSAAPTERRADVAHHPRTRSPAPRCGSACCACPTAPSPPRLAAQPPRRPAGLGHHLHAHGRRGERHRPAAARARARRARLHRARPTPTSARSPRRC